MSKNILRSLIPPIIISLYRRVLKTLEKNDLFRGHGAYFKDRLASSKTYGEYGCGASTIWVSQNCNAQIIAVDTSALWLNSVRDKIPDERIIELIHVDLGELGNWGRPLNYSKRENILDYLNAPWKHNLKPDTILVDGRFRVACFLTSLLLAKTGSVIVFDDYANRPHYHLVEEFVPLHKLSGDQAIFIVPEEIDRIRIKQEIEHFVYVMD